MKNLYFKFILIVVCLLSVFPIKADNLYALGYRDVTRNGIVTIQDEFGVIENVRYTVKIRIKSDTNGYYTSHQVLDYSFGDCVWGEARFKKLEVTNISNNSALITFKITVEFHKYSSGILTDYVDTDTFSFSTAGPYSLEEMPQIK